MIIHNAEQYSRDWYALRLGRATASNFHKIVQPSTGEISRPREKNSQFKLADKVRNFAYYLIAETLLGAPLESISGIEVMERGKEREPMAAKVYSAEFDVELNEVGFITTDDGKVGASPDRLIVGKKAGLEIKCPAPQTHIAYLAEGFGDDYIPQVQGQNMVGEFDYSDRFSFYPGWPTKQQRTYRDETYIKNLEAALREFNDFKESALERIKKEGFFEEHKKILLPIDTAYAGDSIEAGEAAAKLLGGI